MKSITLPAFFDAHVHLREGEILTHVAPWTDACCARALVMPNLTPPVDSHARLGQYRVQVEKAMPRCRPLFTFQLTRGMDPGLTQALAREGAAAGKVYPRGLTTNSEGGFAREDFREFPRGPLGPLLDGMEFQGVVLCLHGEMPGEFCMGREEAFLDFVRQVLRRHPGLRVVLEHVTTAKACRLVAEGGGRIAATVTLHHLEHTLDDVAGDKLKPHHFCKPIPKRPEDREALWDAALANPQVFLGSDSAPHPTGAKQCASGCAGVFTAPALAPRLIELFERKNALDAVGGFTSHRGRSFYGLPAWGREVTLEKVPWQVPQEVGGVTPFLAGEALPCRLAD